MESPSPQAARKVSVPKRVMSGSRANRASDNGQLQLFPPLRDAEYNALRADIAERGQLVPIERDAKTGEIVDGHHRLAICQELGIRPKFVQRTFTNDAERTAHILVLNLLRRNLDPVTWGRMFKKLAEARGVRLGRGGDRKSTAKSAVDAKALAKEMGVSPRTARERVQAADIVEEFPFLEGWKEYRVLEAREHLDKLSAQDGDCFALQRRIDEAQSPAGDCHFVWLRRRT